MRYSHRGTLGLRARIAVAAAGLVAGAASVPASEPIHELGVRVGVESVRPGPSGTQGAPAATARLRVEIAATRTVSDVRARVVSASATGRVEAAGARWSGADGLPLAGIDSSRVALGDGAAWVAYVDVPVSGSGMHDLVVEVSGVTPRGSVTNEAFARVPLGVPLDVVVDDGEVASFPLEVRP